MRDQFCEWETLSDEAPRASKRKYQDLEQRSAGEHELLNHMRSLPEPDSLNLMRRLREGCSINDLLLSARELANNSHNSSSEHALMATQQLEMTYRPHETFPPLGVDSRSTQITEEIRPASRPKLPPISSIWYSTPLHGLVDLLGRTLTLNS